MYGRQFQCKLESPSHTVISYNFTQVIWYVISVMVATEEEMIAADIPPDQRDYCAHHLIDFYKCKREKMPWVASCKDKLHTYRHCEEEE